MPTGRPAADVAEVVAVGRLVAAAEDDRDRPGSQDRADDLAERRLRCFQVAVDAHVAEVEQAERGQVDVRARRPTASAGRASGGSRAAPPAAPGRPSLRRTPSSCGKPISTGRPGRSAGGSPRQNSMTSPSAGRRRAAAVVAAARPAQAAWTTRPRLMTRQTWLTPKW